MNHDVAIVGAGMVGGTLACLLAERGLRVALIEARPRRSAPLAATFEPRVSALGVSSMRTLDHCGVRPLLDPARLGCFREMRVWDQAGSQGVHFDAAEIGEPALGWIVENEHLVGAVERRLDALEGVRWYRPGEASQIDLAEQGVRLSVGEARLTARLLVGADGPRSRVRETLGIAVEAADYGQHAVVATVEVEHGHAETAWQRFLPHGPLAFLPLPGRLCSIVWSTTPEEAGMLLALPEGHFGHRLEDAFEGRLGRVRLLGERLVFPLRRSQAAEYVRARVALVGDAAHTIHPLAGQGVNLGLLDAAVLGEVVGANAAKGRDFGRHHNLRAYERERRGANVLTGAVMTAFNDVFRSRFAPVAWARNAGFAATDRIPALKALFMRAASGLDGDLPAAARAPIDGTTT